MTERVVLRRAPDGRPLSPRPRETERPGQGSREMDGQIYLVIMGTFFGFVALAFVLLYPVYRFLRRQERLADDWTPEAVSRRERSARRTAQRPPDPPDA